MSYKPLPFGFTTPDTPLGWGGQFPASVLSGFLYDLPNQILYTIYPQQQYDVWLQVPISIAQQLTLAGKQNSSQASFPNPDTIYSTNIKKVFPQCLLTERGAPLLCENKDHLVISTGQTIQ